MTRLPHGSGILIATIASSLLWLAAIKLGLAILTGDGDHCCNSLVGDAPAGTTNSAS
jgi:hypothetical protein